MSEAMQSPPYRSSRAERTTTSCSECRRRKQKCNQAQPCSNCARRFPQPVCEYRPGTRRPSSVVVPPQPSPFTLKVSLPPTPAAGDRFSIEDSQSTSQRRRYPSPSLSHWTSRRGEDVGDLGSSLYSWSTAPSVLSTLILACEDDCKAHSGEVHDAVRMLRAYRSVANNPLPSPGNWTPGVGGWPVPPVSPSNGLWPLGSLVQDLAQLPTPRTLQNSELLTTYVKLISQFKASLDGNPDASNPYIKYHVPYCVQSPLLVHVAIYTAACFLSDTGHLDKTVAMAHKGFAIQMLNDHINSTPSPSDEGITGVVQLIIDEWYWGDPNHLHTHLRGLRDMIRIRGGFRALGLHGLISKSAITADAAIALSFESTPFLRGGSEFEYRDNFQVPLRLALNTPFISSLVRFSSCDEALRIHPAVASILDDMRFLLSTVLALPEKASPKELQKVHTTSAWIHNRIASLPSEGPTVRKGSSAPSPAAPSTPGSTSGRDVRGTPDGGDEQQRNRQTSSRSRSRGQRPQGSRGRMSLQVESPEQWERAEAAERASSPPADPPDFIYKAVRLAALMYSQAIKFRRPFSAIVSTDDFLQLWTTCWRVPLGTWRSLLGVFNWLLVPLVPCGKRPHDRFVKAMLNVSLFQIGMDNWEIACGAMEGALKLQRWLDAEREAFSPEGGGSSFERRSRNSDESMGDEEDEDMRYEEDEEEIATAGSSKGKGKEMEPGFRGTW